MFCPECGTKIDEPMNFCPECGTNLIGLFAEMEAEEAANKPQQTVSTPSAQPAAPTQSAQSNRIETVHADLPAAEPESPAAQTQPEENLPEPVMRGFILTNLTSLSKHLRTSVDALRDIFNQFIATKRRIGVAYQLVDAGDYEYLEKGLFGGHKHVKLGASSPWYEYADILLDLNKAEKKAKQPETDFLFIVGGNEVVPMPKLPHWQRNNPDFSDDDFDTDFLYAYPYGKEMEEKMWNGRIFTYDALFYVGRLPLVGGDEGLQDLINYFNRDLENSAGIQVEMMYAQSDPNWKGVTTKNVAPLLKQLKVLNYQKATPPSDGFGYDYLILSPTISLETDSPQYHTSSWFNPYAQFVFINMHGSDEPNYPYYGGYAMGSRSDFQAGLAPDMFGGMQYPNIIFAQPCYGARFIGYPKEKSMVLTALSNQTLVFVGSSRIALGYPKGNCSLDQVNSLPICCSDITGYVFNDLAMKGYPLGVAFFQARCETYRLGDKGWEEALTIGEFNLFGDPTLFCAVDEGGKSVKKASKAALTNDTNGIFITSMETVMQKSANKPQSMLEQLRQQVNKNILDISESIGKHLYEEYGIPKREPFFVQKVKYSNGAEQLDFHYGVGENENARSEMIVQTDANGDIKSVVQSK